ncbi:MAG: InlB B-repeat-containing protein, partial [Bacteroidales bacterium]|nr:InlB B-repeat-containing protein [Bacteroidales bacterium]
MTTFQIIGVIFMAVCAVGIIYSLRKGDKSRYHYLLLTLVMVASGQSAFAQTTWSLQPTSSGNTITYKVKRSGDISQAVTVRYRTVGLSSYEGENFTSANGTLTFPAGIDQQIVTVTTQTPSTEAYKYYQSGAARKYLFEVTDMGGFTLLSREDNAGAGTVFNTSYLNQSVTDLVYFNSNGAIKSGDGNKYVDASYSSSSWVQVTDGGYSQAVHTISTNNLYSNNSSATSFRSYLNEIGYNMYATVYFTQMEEQDGYQYIQILADNSSTYDGNDPNGAVNAPSTSLYKACFILSYDPSGSVMSEAHYQFFPHRYDYVDMAAEQTAGITHYEFDYDNSHLYQQKFRTTSYQASTSGSLVLAPTVNNLNVRFDAAGSGGDTWDFKNLKVRLALVDATKPKIRNNNDIRVADGAYGYGNTVYITIPFTEIVTVTGNPTLSTTWGELNYLAGSGTNVLTFSGHIEADLGTVLTINSIGGTSFTIKDLMGNTYNNTSINKTYSGLQVTNPWAGSGTANDPYIIMDSYQLNLLSKLVWAGNYYENKYFKLGANITYSSSTSWSSTSSFTSNFTSIGGWGHSFRGIFDGDGHSISGIRIYKSGSSTDDECQGLFGYASSATIKNLVLYNVNIVGYKQVGAIAGSQTYGTFQDCYIYNTRVAATSGTQQEVIAGSISGGNRDRIYFKNCKIGSNAGQHNIVKLTLTNDATVTRTPVTTVNSTLTTYSDGATISGEEYYSPDATITLGYSGSVPSGSFVKYTASTSTGDITFTNIDGNVLTMPDADVTVSAAILPEVTYLDANGDAHQCSDYTLITSSTSNVEMGASGKTHWYVVSSDATINAMLKFTDATANLILCNGATLNVNRTNSGSAVFANNLNIFGQTNGNGTLNATVSNGSGISSNALGIYGGIVSASGGDYGINAGGNSITLGYTAAANRVTASSYLCNSLTVKAGQTLTDGEGHIYSGTYTGNDLNSTLTAMATKTLQPAYSITLPANFTVTGTTAAQGYASANEVVTIHTAEGYTITSASYTPAGGSATTINPVEGVWSFTMPAANTTVNATRVVNTYTVHFDANATNGIDVTGTMEDMDFTYGQAQNLTINDFERTGYTFDGWNTAADGTGTAYSNQ